MQRILLFISFFIVFTSSAKACDVSLFLMLSGKTMTEAFTEDVTVLAIDARHFSQRFSDESINQALLEKLLEKWLEFCNNFQNSPPEWAIQDKNWITKFRRISELLGAMRRSISQKSKLTHYQLQKFSRLLSGLYEYKPLDIAARNRMRVTRQIDLLWDSYQNKSIDSLTQSVDDFIIECKILINILPEALISDGKNLLGRGYQIQDMIKTDNIFKGILFELLLNITENEFIDLNEKVCKETGKMPESQK